MKAPRGATGPVSSGPAPSGAVRSDERLTPPWWWLLPGLVVVGLVYLDVRLGHPTWPAWAVAVVLVALLGLAFHRAGRARVGVRDDAEGRAELHVGPAVLPVRFVADARVVPTKDKQEELGPRLDPAAFVLHKPWIGPLVRVQLDDPADPTPYWLFSSRRPEALVESLRASSARS